MTYHTKWKAFLKEDEGSWYDDPQENESDEPVGCPYVETHHWEEFRDEMRRTIKGEVQTEEDIAIWTEIIQDGKDDWTAEFNDTMTNHDKKWAAWQRHYDGEIDKEEWDHLRAKHGWKDVDPTSAELNSF